MGEEGTATRKLVLDRLEEEVTQELLDRLVAHAHMKTKRLFWHGILGAPMPEGLEPEDIVAGAVFKVIQGAGQEPGRGRRSWDGTGDVFHYLRSVVDSDLNHLAESWVNQHFRTEATATRVAETNRSSRTTPEHPLAQADGSESHRRGLPMRTPDPSPEAALINKELEQASDEFFWGFYESVDEEELRAVLEQIHDGARKPAEIAAALDVPVDRIYNARKRLDRRLVDFQAQWQDGKEESK